MASNHLEILYLLHILKLNKAEIDLFNIAPSRGREVVILEQYDWLRWKYNRGLILFLKSLTYLHCKCGT